MSDIRKYIELLESFEKPLDEAHVTDAYPKQFNRFLDKYKSKKKTNLYVQFTDHKDNTLDKGAFNNPTNHSDFVGIYAYPLSYVAKHPMDVWYGNNAKYIRIIQAKDVNTLDFTGMSKEQAERLLNMLPINFFRNSGFDRNTVLEDIIKSKEIKGKNRWSRALLTVIQHDLKDGEVSVEPRNGLEQTKIVKQLGFDAILDRAKSHKTATVNDREPEQIVFLSRNAFKIIDIFHLHDNDANTTATSGKQIDEKFVRKLAAMISMSIGTKLHDMMNVGLNYVAWTKRGDQIVLTVMNTPSSLKAVDQGMDLTIGKKPHRFNTDYDNNTVSIKIKSNRGEINTKLDEDHTIQQVSDYIKTSYESLSVDDSFVPYSKEQYLQKKEDERKEDAKKRVQKDNEQSIVSYNNVLKPLIDHYGITELSNYGEDNGYKIYEFIKKYFERSESESIDEYMNSIMEKLKESPSKLLRNVLLKRLDEDMLPYIITLVKNLESDGIVKTGSLYFKLRELTDSKGLS